MRWIFLISLICFSNSIFPQIGGDDTYSFLNLNTSARSASLGGKTIAIDDQDLNLSYHNPALLRSGMSSHLSMNYVNYFAGINYGYSAYSFQGPWNTQMATGIHYLNYGEFQRANKYGEKTGTFNASEYALNIIFSKPLDTNFTLGVNLKPIYSNLESYKSYGVAADLGLTYTDTSGLFTAALVLKNIGFQVVPYHGETRESLPFEIQLGFSLKLRHAPFRLITNFNHLETPNLRYRKPDLQNKNATIYENDEPGSTFSKNIDKLMRHVSFGVEITPINNFYVRFGYNYRKRQELKIPSKPGTVGFSWGFGLKVFNLNLNYGSADYHLAGNTNHFSIRANLNKLFSK
jgi:hypothetical protein